MVAHELRSPLAGITGTLATLRQRSQQLTQAEREELLGLAIGQAARLGRLIDLLLRAVGPTTTVPAAGQVVDAAQLARDAIRLATLAHPTQPFTLVFDVVGALQVRADADAVHGVLANLLDNAARHTPTHTQVWVEAARRGQVAVLAVEDAGPGIPAALRGRVFAPFEQLHPAGQQAGGVGLGLYIARRLARAQAGELLAVDPRRSPQGARFELRLPVGD
jgi:two-component system OmpR family sensor kinase